MKRLLNAASSTWGAVKSSLRALTPADLAICAVGLAFAIVIRYLLLDFKSSDFLNSLKPWYVTIRDMGFSAFGTDFTTYNPPYLYELYLIARFFPDTSNLLATKIPSLIGDFIGAVFVYALVKHRYTTGLFAPLAAFAFLLAPTVVLNSAFWGQADILFTAPLLAALYFLMKRRNTWAMLAFGVGLAFKLQAVFLAPLLFGLFLRGNLTWKQLLMVPLVLLAAMVPAAAAGRPILDLLGVYIFQAGQYQLLQMSAPTVYSWMPDYGLTQRFFTPGGVVFTAALGFALSILVYKTRAAVTDDLLLRLSLLCFLLVPFFLPKMHDRYFYPADVLAIIFAFYYPRYFFVPIVVILSSYFAYHPTLFEVETVPMGFLAAGMFTMLVVVARDALAHLLAPEAAQASVAAAVELHP
jgi:Gpi18-like mannosyltransferase